MWTVDEWPSGRERCYSFAKDRLSDWPRMIQCCSSDVSMAGEHTNVEKEIDC